MKKSLAFTLAEGATHVETCCKYGKIAFTLAELMITLGVIGVVAAVTMPSLIANVNERIYEKRYQNIVQKVTQAMERMRALDKLNANYATTDDFVNELQNYLKISKRCSANEIANCWTTSTVLDKDGNNYTVSNAKKGNNINLATTTDNVGIVLADGANLIINYNPNSVPLDIGSKIKSKAAQYSSERTPVYTTTVTDSIDFITDVNSSKGPNKEGKDIRSLKIAGFTDLKKNCDDVSGNLINRICVKDLEDTYDCVSETPFNNNDNCWAGAIKACQDLEPIGNWHIETTVFMHDQIGKGNFTGAYWVNESYGGARTYAHGIDMYSLKASDKQKTEKQKALCIYN